MDIIIFIKHLVLFHRAKLGEKSWVLRLCFALLSSTLCVTCTPVGVGLILVELTSDRKKGQDCLKKF